MDSVIRFEVLDKAKLHWQLFLATNHRSKGKIRKMKTSEDSDRVHRDGEPSPRGLWIIHHIEDSWLEREGRGRVRKQLWPEELCCTCDELRSRLHSDELETVRELSKIVLVVTQQID